MRHSKDKQISALLEECTDMMMSGTSLVACLECFPDDATELEPLLATVASVRELRPVPLRQASIASNSRAAFISEVLRLQEPRKAGNGPASRGRRLSAAPRPATPRARPISLVAILLVIFMSGMAISGSITLAADARPGDLLYRVRTVSENVRIFFTLETETRNELRAAYRQRRIDEARTIEIQRLADKLNLRGLIESFDTAQ